MAQNGTGKTTAKKHYPQTGRCNAKLRGERAGEFCRSHPVPGKRRCKMHGGASTGPRVNAGRTHGAYELVGKGNKIPHVRPDALNRMTADELARLEQLREMSDLAILDGHLRILVIARERLTPDHIDAHVKLAMAEGRLIEAKARLAPRRIELSGADGAPIETKMVHDLSRLSDKELTQLEALMDRAGFVDDDDAVDSSAAPDAR
jgi:hypothetical protein